MRRDSACELKSPILRRGLAHYRLDKSLRPRLESGDFSSTILESQSSTENTKQGAAAVSLVNPTASDFTPKHTQSHDSISKILESQSSTESTSPAASKFKLESAFSLSSRASEALFLSSRADEVGVAIHTSRLESTLTKLDSSISAFLNNLIYFTQAHFLAVFFSPFLWLIGLTPRSFMRPLLLAPCSNFSKTNALFATAETMDCHADFQSARNDRNNATTQNEDSRSKAQPKTPQAAGFCDDFGGFQAVGAGIYLVGNEQAHRAGSTKSAQNKRSEVSLEKPTPKSSKNEDSRSKAQPTHHDSKHCGGAVVALRDFGGRARLEVCGCPQNRAINRIAYPRLNRRQRQKHLIPFFKESL
ncbi:hypothetical protein [Helicobacter canis]|uniref:Uncharacterized protein n=1 Tax=Helicobacter canis TaxID=29419 RepID=A0A377J4S7_9HELI|nr:hypothetical protein [Helicobacter canis]STO97358.1 Uncharacterised protein [Helicobacter canis]